MRMVVLADDLSGAAELGAIALRYGLTAEVQTEFDPSAPADVCLVDTDTRLGTAEAAVRRTAQIARRIIAMPPTFVYKKVDSILRGSVLAEVRAVARTLGRARVVLVSANPSRGRVIRDGRYYVDDLPLHQSRLASDPEHPRRTADVRQLLDEAGAGPLPAAIALGLSEIPVSAPDVATSADLAGWAAQLAPDVLPAGAADFFAAILAAQGRGPTAARPAAEPFAAPRRTLLVCGSVAAWTQRRADAEAAGIPVVQAPPEVFLPQRDESLLERWGDRLAEALSAAPVVLTGLGEYPPADAGVAVTLAKPPSALALVRRLAEAVGRALRLAPVDRFLLEGGATAAAIVRQQGWSRLTVVGEPGPGVAELEPLDGVAERPPRLFVKPGSYSWPDAVWNLLGTRASLPNATPLA